MGKLWVAGSGAQGGCVSCTRVCTGYMLEETGWSESRSPDPLLLPLHPYLCQAKDPLEGNSASSLEYFVSSPNRAYMHPELGLSAVCMEVLSVVYVLFGKFHNHTVVT